MVELISLHGLDKANIVNVFGEFGKAIGNPRAAFAMLLERKLMSEHLWRALDEKRTAFPATMNQDNLCRQAFSIPV